MIERKDRTIQGKEKSKERNRSVNQYIKKLVIAYQESGSDEDFERILYHTDYLLLKIIHKIRRSVDFTRSVDIHDLYHTAIIGLYQAVKKIPKHEDPNKIPAWISSYITLNINKAYGYLKRETMAEDIDLNYMNNLHVIYEMNPFIMFDLKDFLDRKIITKLEYDTIISHIMKEIRTCDIAREEGTEWCCIANRIKRAVIKMRRVVEYGNFDCRDPIFCSSPLKEDRK